MYLGIDFGTSGCRATVIDQQQHIVAESAQSLPLPVCNNGRVEQQASVWIKALNSLLDSLARKASLEQIERIAVDGTSTTTLICDENGSPLSPALMYNDQSSLQAAALIKQKCPSVQHSAMATSSSLAKAIQLLQQIDSPKVKVLHQSDYISNYLTNSWGTSDYHNTLKLGYDPVALNWPEWVKDCISESSLPYVTTPGTTVSTIDSNLAAKFGFSTNCQICSGTTDSIASFLATQISSSEQAVTSLGSTIVLKMLCDQPTEDLRSGIYSHRLGNLWLTGGASNAGAAILRKYFSDQRMIELSPQMNVNTITGLQYYPLKTVGERFPVYDPNKQPCIHPRPESDVLFFQGLLESLSYIEKTGYQKLEALGVNKPKQIQTTGGGAKNEQWCKMRQNLLGLPVVRAEHTQASFGAALLAHSGLQPFITKH